MPVTKKSGSTTTAIVLPVQQLELVKRAALTRALLNGASRVSASDVIRDALAAYEPTLRAEAARFPNVPIRIEQMG